MNWINLPEFPKDHQDVLFLTTDGTYKIGHFKVLDKYNRPNMFYTEMGFFRTEFIICWMSLPEMPDGVKIKKSLEWNKI